MGGALDQLLLVTVLWKNKYGTGMRRRPTVELPPRAMTNLLMPVGVPRRAWTQVPMEKSTNTGTSPHQVVGNIGTHLVYLDQGVMPDRIPSWIQTDKGIRWLQHQELVKAKGLLENFEMPTSKTS
jgi:hypothetical protein